MKLLGTDPLLLQKDLQGLPSVYDSVPNDFGGIYARQGFAFQDDVAVRFYIEMLADANLIEVSCETHDDILLVWKCGDMNVLEFVQVKAEHPDQLWGIPKLCARTVSTTNPKGIGTSIIEKSFSRDKYKEIAVFRIVTCRQIQTDLVPLTWARSPDYRSIKFQLLKNLIDAVIGRLGDVRSNKDFDLNYWLFNALWEVLQEADIAELNKGKLIRILYDLNLPHDPDTVQETYSNLLALAKETAEYGLDKWKEKYISRSELLEKLNNWINPYPNMNKNQRLEKKLTDAGLDQVCLEVAKEQQRYYLSKKRAATYLRTGHADDIDQRVLGTLHSLRSSLDSGRIQMSGIEFHDLCLKEVSNLSDNNFASITSVTSEYLSGCMYEITSRCRHRFTRFFI